MVLPELAGIGLALIVIFAWIIAAIPFWIGLRLIGVKASLLSVAGITFIGVLLQSVVNFMVVDMYGSLFGGLIAYLAWVFLIKFYFDLSFMRSVLATIMPALILVGLLFVLVFL